MKDSMGDRLKDIESRTRYLLPRRCYTLIRIDGKAFHTYTRKCERPFDQGLREDMQETTRLLCSNIQGCKIGYTQSDEISLLLTDFDSMQTDAWFDGNVQKIVSVAASMASAYFNKLRVMRSYERDYEAAVFDCRVWTTADPWEAYNTFLWRQKDAVRNSVQMVARSVASHKECEKKGFSELEKLIVSKGCSYDDFPVDCKHGAFVIRNDEKKWVVDKIPPILSQDKNYFFSRIPMIPQFGDETELM